MTEMKMDAVYDKETGEELIRPPGYKGRLYPKVAYFQTEYLRALGNVGTGKFVDYREWIKQCEIKDVTTNQGRTPQRVSPAMIYGVFASRGYIEVQKDKETGLNLYCLTEMGKWYLESPFCKLKLIFE